MYLEAFFQFANDDGDHDVFVENGHCTQMATRDKIIPTVRILDWKQLVAELSCTRFEKENSN